MDSPFQRVVVIGTSGSGKTTLARRLSRALGSPHIELDDLFWLADWKPREREDFRDRVRAAVAADRWVADGNYSSVRDLVWPRATAIVWLDYSFGRVFGRVLRRTLRRSIRREPLFGGNRESLRRAFLSRESILLWVITTFRRHRREFRQLRGTAECRHLAFHVFRYPAATEAFVQSLEGQAASAQR